MRTLLLILSLVICGAVTGCIQINPRYDADKEKQEEHTEQEEEIIIPY